MWVFTASLVSVIRHFWAHIFHSSPFAITKCEKIQSKRQNGRAGACLPVSGLLSVHTCGSSRACMTLVLHRRLVVGRVGRRSPVKVVPEGCIPTDGKDLPICGVRLCVRRGRSCPTPPMSEQIWRLACRAEPTTTTQLGTTRTHRADMALPLTTCLSLTPARCAHTATASNVSRHREDAGMGFGLEWHMPVKAHMEAHLWVRECGRDSPRTTLCQ